MDTINPQALIDLHLHTTYSDGRWTAIELLDHAVQEHFTLLAVTDHDNVEMIVDTQKRGAERGTSVIAAVEISAALADGRMADVLCYGFDPRSVALRALTQKVKQGQKDNADEVYTELIRRGYEFPRRQEILAKNQGELRVAGDVGILAMKHGYVDGWAAAFELIRDAGYEEFKADIAETIETVHKAGGVALIAHPGRGLKEPMEFTYYTPELLDEVRAAMPLDGIEVYYPTHTPEQVAMYEAYVDQHRLLKSAGSDSHGPPGRMPIGYAAVHCRALLERLGFPFIT